MRKSTLSALMAVFVSLCVTTPVFTQQPVGEIAELEEIWVEGKRLSVSIVEAEDAFFKVYNKLNKNSDYDVHCGTTSLDRGSMIMIRKCSPGFIVYNFYNPVTNTVSLGDQCYRSYTQYTDSRDGMFQRSSCVGAYTSYSLPPKEHILAARGPDYARNVMSVVKSDPRLLKMAADLAVKYDELKAAQQRYVKVRQASAPPPRVGQPARSHKGPRAPL